MHGRSTRLQYARTFELVVERAEPYVYAVVVAEVVAALLSMVSV